MKTLKNLKLIFPFLFIALLFSCNNDINTISPSEGDSSSSISVRLVDEPGDFDHVFIDVVDVMIKYNDDSEDDSGWQSLDPINTGVYDLLELTGGIDVLLVDDYQLPPGTLNQIRLVLGEDNSVVRDGGEPIPLRTPSAQQSGLKLQVNHELEAGFTYNFLLDFNVDESIVVAGNSDNINLKPVIRVSTDVTSGKIMGTVNPFDFQVEASVMVDGETVSAYADETGLFMLNGVPAGTYSVTITPEGDSGYAEAVVDNVEVVNGEVTDIGTVDLELVPVVGSITGTITNEGVVVTASVMVDAQEITADTNENGLFLLEDIPVGTYTVYLTPADGSGLTATQVDNVEVTENGVTDLGEITLN
jgi:hypothetical protein